MLCCAVPSFAVLCQALLCCVQMLPPVIMAAVAHQASLAETKKAALTQLALTHDSSKLAGYAEVGCWIWWETADIYASQQLL